MESSRELRTREDWEELLQSIDTVLFDCDGLSLAARPERS